MKNDEVFGFAFGKTICSSVLYKLKNIDCCYLVFGVTSIDDYLSFLLKNQPKYILGLGVYSRIDQDKIRIEEICTNKFRNDFVVGDNLKTYAIKPFIKPNELSKTAQGIGNSYCNYISFRIIQLIKDGKLKSEYTFLHIPKKLSSQLASKVINEMLIDFKRVR